MASFAATTLDTATRLQRYVVQELSATVKFKSLTNRYAATALAVALAGYVAIFTGSAPGTGGMTLWPMFGAMNQLLAGLAFLVVLFYLFRHGRPVWFLVAPMLIMLVIPAWAMLWKMFNPTSGWLCQKNYLLFGFGAAIEGLTAWLVLEGLLIWKKARAEATASRRGGK